MSDERTHELMKWEFLQAKRGKEGVMWLWVKKMPPLGTTGFSLFFSFTNRGEGEAWAGFVWGWFCSFFFFLWILVVGGFVVFFFVFVNFVFLWFLVVFGCWLLVVVVYGGRKG